MYCFYFLFLIYAFKTKLCEKSWYFTGSAKKVINIIAIDLRSQYVFYKLAKNGKEELS